MEIELRIFSFNAAGASNRNASSLSRLRIARSAAYSLAQRGHSSICRCTSRSAARSSSPSRCPCISTRASSQVTPSPWPIRSLSERASLPRARASRDMTVPIGTSAASAISLYESPSISRITITSRNSSVSSSSAARIIAPSALRTASASSPLSSLTSAVHLLVEFRWLIGSPVALEPGERRVAHDRENPRARIAAAKSARKPERAQIGVLHDVLCVVVVMHQPSGEVVRSIHMREEGAVEIEGFAFVRQSLSIRPPASFNSRLRAPQSYSLLPLRLNRGNFLQRAESSTVKAHISARRLEWKPNLIVDRSCASRALP